jgi:hypothetical protein
MASLSTRQKHLHLAVAKRRAAMKGEKYNSHKRSSMKFRKIMRNNNLILRQFKPQF